ncbi:MAG: M1 family peptidase [Chitinophagaceae bacterium]|nr:MAG: M1 family peptidase [Chitinophagaceae bacterium]
MVRRAPPERALCGIGAYGYFRKVKRLLPVLLSLAALTVKGQQASWQQRTNYTIDVTLDAATKSLDGFERLTYHNASPDTLRYIWFHLWPNAFKNDRTAFTDQQLRNGDTRYYFASKDEHGYINRLDFRVNGAAARTEDHPQWIDVVKLLLPSPLPPGSTATITTPFHVKLPYNFSRGGFAGNSFQVTQWYPKPAVYDEKGWHPMPYLDQGEFYSEFGSYDVRIKAPVKYIVAATGSLQPDDASGPQPVAAQGNAAKSLTHRYTQQNAHDFAWFADTGFIVKSDTCRLPSGHVINVSTYYTSAEKKYWDSSLYYAKAALRFYSTEVGDYPYDVCKVVQGPDAFGGGMEYPTITVIEPIHSARELDITIAHEIGHNWFYGALANNERDAPWLDEGFNSYYERRYTRARYGADTDAGFEELLFLTLVHQKRDQPIATPADSMTDANYQLVTYYKTARWLEGIEQTLGRESMQRMMQGWYAQNKFRHVQPEDFYRHLQRWAPRAAATFPAQLQHLGALPIQQRKAGTALLTPFQPKTFQSYLQQPKRAAWLLSPAFGANRYDRLMIGAVLTNYLLPPPKLRLLLLPLYATGPKQWNGLGRLSYSMYPDRGPKRIELFTAASTFSYNEFTDDKDRRFTARFFKVAPGAELEFRNRDRRSLQRRLLQWKSYFIGEQPFRISYDSVITATDTTLALNTSKRDLRFSVHQLAFRIDNIRALYPYSAAAWVQTSAYFTRLHLEGNYFFNYPKGGGLSLRAFAGKLLYDRHRSDYPYGLFPGRFFLNMSGASGEEDYTYSHYFVGRSAFEGITSQQIAIRDGGFKMRTPLLSQPVGQSDDWLTALNFNTSIPEAVNPLRVLPIKVPLHLFFDIGTQAGAWEAGATGGRFLFEGGLHLPVAGGLVNFYFPIVYSKVYREYAQSMYPKNRFFKTMTFSIDLQRTSGLIKNQRLF